jgi:AMIN domain
MRRICQPTVAWTLMLAGVVICSPSAAQTSERPVAKVRTVTVTGGGKSMEVEIATSQPVAVRSQVTTSPDRLILDFPNAVPGTGLRNQAIDRGQVKGIRVGLFEKDPPVTRVVFDLKGPQPYQIFPSGKTVIVKLTSENQPSAQINPVSFMPEPAKPESKVEVEYQDGRLRIMADNASLADVLRQVQLKTGTEIVVPPAAAQELVVVSIAPAPVREALGALLNGSRFNFIMVSSDQNPAKLKRVILSFREAGAQPGITSSAPAVTENQPAAEPEPEPAPQPETQAQPQEARPSQDAPPQQQQENPPPQQENYPVQYVFGRGRMSVLHASANCYGSGD